LLLNNYDVLNWTIDILSRPYFTVIITVISLCITIVIAVISRKKKRLSYKLINLLTIVELNKNFTSDITIHYKGDLVDNVSIVDLKILNDGNMSIEPSDFYDKIKINFKGKIFLVEQIINEPKNLNPHFAFENNTASVDGLLLNPGDYFIFRSYISGYPTDKQNSEANISEPISRIKGIKSITKIKKRIHFRYYIYAIMLVEIIIVQLLFRIYCNDMVITNIITCIGFILFFAWLFSDMYISLKKSSITVNNGY
jgi:hypothetical protein